VALPFAWVEHAPVFRLITPVRAAVYPALALAIGIAAWLAAPPSVSGRRRMGRWAVFGLGAVMIFPNVASGLWGGSPSNPSFFTSAAYRQYLRPGENVIAIPYGYYGNSMLWQAETGFYFRMAGGYLGHLPPAPFSNEPVLAELYAGKEINRARLASFVASHHVGAILLDETQIPSVQRLFAQLNALGLSSISMHGVLMYFIPENGI
jgi:hypothetical protein